MALQGPPSFPSSASSCHSLNSPLCCITLTNGVIFQEPQKHCIPLSTLSYLYWPQMADSCFLIIISIHALSPSLILCKIRPSHHYLSSTRLRSYYSFDPDHGCRD